MKFFISTAVHLFLTHYFSISKDTFMDNSLLYVSHYMLKALKEYIEHTVFNYKV